MTTAASIDATAAGVVSGEPGVPRVRSRRRRWLLACAVVGVLAAAGAVMGVAGPFNSGGRAKGGAVDNAYPTSLAMVTRQGLSSQTQVSATLGYGGTYSVVNQAQGTITSLPTVGQVISQGQILYQVNDTPVVLLYGSTPAYRNLSTGMSGPDVTELNADLVALGYASPSDLSPTSDHFSSETARALEKLEKALGMTANGTLTLGQAAFLPSSARITTESATLVPPLNQASRSFRPRRRADRSSSPSTPPSSPM